MGPAEITFEDTTYFVLGYAHALIAHRDGEAGWVGECVFDGYRQIAAVVPGVRYQVPNQHAQHAFIAVEIGGDVLRHGHHKTQLALLKVLADAVDQGRGVYFQDFHVQAMLILAKS